jgi:hypothetical protein
MVSLVRRKGFLYGCRGAFGAMNYFVQLPGIVAALDLQPLEVNGGQACTGLVQVSQTK